MLFDIMRKVAIIPCAGHSARWNRYLGVQKHLAPLNHAGQTILGRTVDLVKSNGLEGIYVVTDKPEIQKAQIGASFVTPTTSTYLASTILSTKEVWADRNIVLLGDVYYSSDAMKKILGDGSSIKFYGIDRASLPVRLSKRRPEIFAFAFSMGEAETVTKALNLNIALASVRESTPQGRFWMPRCIYYSMNVNLQSLGIDETKADVLKRLLTYNYSPDPPQILKRTGLKPNRIWTICHAVISKVCAAHLYGKLWGVYMLLAQIGPFSGEDCSWPQSDNPLFDEIDDITQDCDAPGDYHQLLSMLNRNSER